MQAHSNNILRVINYAQHTFHLKSELKRNIENNTVFNTTFSHTEKGLLKYGILTLCS
jgi:hypothetical protein